MDQNPRILYIEDSAENQMLISYYVKKEPIEVICASDGYRAVEMLREQSFDLILLDLNLPDGFSGLDMIHAIRKEPRYHDTPLVVLTASLHNEINHTGIQPYIDDFITKPIRKNEFLEMIKRNLKASGSE